MELKPLQKCIISAVKEFLYESDVAFNARDKEFSLLHHNPSFAKDFHSIEFLLPRRSGSTHIIHQLCHIYNGLVIMPFASYVGLFLKNHAKLFPGDKPIVITIHQAKESHNMLVTDFELLKQISDALKRSNVILFDAFRAYDENSAVKHLMKELGRTHRFVFFR